MKAVTSRKTIERLQILNDTVSHFKTIKDNLERVIISGDSYAFDFLTPQQIKAMEYLIKSLGNSIADVMGEAHEKSNNLKLGLETL